MEDSGKIQRLATRGSYGAGGKWMLLVPRREGNLIGTENRGMPRECWEHEGHIVLGDRVIEKTLQRGGWNKIRE